jgi:hypothetical protein
MPTCRPVLLAVCFPLPLELDADGGVYVLDDDGPAEA